MPPKPHLAIDNDEPVDIGAALLAILEANPEAFGGDDGDSDPAPTKLRHQLMHMDFWFLTGALGCQLAIMTSFIPMNAFEPLVVASIILLFCAVVSNLTREKQGIIVHEVVQKWIVNVRLPDWGGFRVGWIPPEAPLVERVNW